MKNFEIVGWGVMTGDETCYVRESAECTGKATCYAAEPGCCDMQEMTPCCKECAKLAKKDKIANTLAKALR